MLYDTRIEAVIAFVISFLTNLFKKGFDLVVAIFTLTAFV